jgi:polar amino acid transport system substrate-binding protein
MLKMEGIMKRLIVMALFLLFSSMGTAQTIEDIQWITEEYPPYNYVENDDLKGIAVDTLLAVWKKIGLNKTVKDIKVVPWARGVKMVKTKPGTCLFSTTITKERKDVLGWKFVYPIPLISDESENQVIARKSKNIVFNSMEDLKKFNGTYGVVRGDVGEGLLMEAGVNTANLDKAANPISLVKKLDKGRYDLISYSFSTAKTKMKEAGIDASKYHIIFVFPPKPMGYAFYHSTDKSILEKLQKALDELHIEGVTEKIRMKYLKK